MKELITTIKDSRQRIDALLDVLIHHQQSREYYKGYDNLQLGFMRLGVVLSVLGNDNPYPQSTNPENKTIEPPADKAMFVLDVSAYQEDETQLVKFIRQTIGNEIKTLSDSFKSHWSREPNGTIHEARIALDSLQDAKMWFGQVLNSIRTAELKRKEFLEENEKAMWNVVREAYHRYGAVTDFKNFQGNPMPEFDVLPDPIKKAWFEAIQPFDRSMGNSASMGRDIHSNRCL